MLKTINTVAIGLMALTAHAQTGFLIQGKVSGDHEGKKVILYYPNPAGLKENVSDSTTVKNGTFSFKGSVGHLTNAILQMKDRVEKYEPRYLIERLSRDDQNFFLENTNYTVTGPNIKKALIKGGPVQADYLALKKELKTAEANMWVFTKKMIHYDTTGNKAASDKLFSESRGLRKAIDDIEDNFRIKHPDSYVSLDLIEGRGGIMDPGFESKFNRLSPRIRNSYLGREMKSKYLALRSVDVGKPAKDFTQNDIEGIPVTLSAFKGKYVLLDFWASWCGPCRNQHPYMIKAYQKFKDKGFEIIAVSLDSKKEAWLKAIAEDGVPWIHLSNLKGTKNQAALLYGVTGIPENFLINPEGIIVAKSLHGEDFEKKLEEIIR